MFNVYFQYNFIDSKSGSSANLIFALMFAGWTRDEVEENPRMQYALGEILKFNMIAPVPNNYAVYNFPFLNADMVLPTLFSDVDTVVVKKWPTGGTGFQGPHNSGTVQDQDFDNASCKVSRGQVYQI